MLLNFNPYQFAASTRSDPSSRFPTSGCRAQKRLLVACRRQVRMSASVGKAKAGAVAAPGTGVCEDSWRALDLAVIGGGPAGLAAAVALQRVRPDLRIKIFEACPEYIAQGAGVGLSPNGLRALEAIDPLLMHRVVEAGVFLAMTYEYNDETGERMPWQYASRPLEQWDKRGQLPGILPWNAIRTTLYRGLPDGMVEFGCKVTGLQPEPVSGASKGHAAAGQDADVDSPWHAINILRPDPLNGGVREVLARARYVIAADGYFSKIRRAAGDGQPPAFEGMVRWLGTVTEADLASGRVPIPNVLDSQRDPLAGISFHSYKPTSAENPLKSYPYRSLNLYAVERTPDRGLRFVWSLYTQVKALEDVGEVYPMPRVHEDDAAAEAMQGPDLEHTSAHQTSRRGARVLQRALAVASHLPEDVRAMLAATPPDRVLEFGLHQHSKDTFQPGAWVHDGLLVLGDAAHAGKPSGQGCNLSIEDAAVLGSMVKEHGLGSKAFSAWEQARLPRVRDILYGTDFSQTQKLVFSASFEPLWCPLAMAAPGGPLPEEVAREVREAVSAGGEDKGREVVLAWSRGVVRAIAERRSAGWPQLETVEPPTGTYRTF